MLCPNCKTQLEKDPDGIHYVCPSCESRFKVKQKTEAKPTPPPVVKPKPKVKPKPMPVEDEEDEYGEDETFGDDSYDDDFDDGEEDDEFDEKPKKKSKQKSSPKKRGGGGLNMSTMLLAILCVALAVATGFMFFQYQSLRKNYDNLVQQQQSFDSFSSFNEASDIVSDPLATEPTINTEGMEDSVPYTDDMVGSSSPADDILVDN